MCLCANLKDTQKCNLIVNGWQRHCTADEVLSHTSLKFHFSSSLEPLHKSGWVEKRLVCLCAKLKDTEKCDLIVSWCSVYLFALIVANMQALKT